MTAHDSAMERYMQLALAEAQRGQAQGEHPFGAVLVDARGEVVLARHDTVAQDRDPTSHAETLLVREAIRRIGPDLSDHTLYTTCEPCPMCFTTSWLARVGRLVYGTTMEQVRQRTRHGIDELLIPAMVMNGHGRGRIDLVGGVLADACLALFSAAPQPEAVA